MNRRCFSCPWSFDWASCLTRKRFLDAGATPYLFRTQAAPSSSKPPAAYDQWYACPTCPTSGLLLCFASFFLLRSEPSHDAHPRLPLFKTCMPYGHADGSGGDVAVLAATAATAAAWVTAVMVGMLRPLVAVACPLVSGLFARF